MKLRFVRLSDRTPPREIRLFTWGENDTLKGKFYLTRHSATELMIRYREHGVDLMLDYEHGSLDPAATPEQKKAGGWGDLEVREDGLYLVNIRWTPAAVTYLKNAEFRYLSPAFNINDQDEIVELVNVAITNLPATHNQQALVAASAKPNPKPKRSTEMNIHEHLKAALGKHGGHEGLAKHLGFAPEKLAKHLAGEPMTHEEMKACATKLGLQEHEIEDEEAPIDTSYNGLDVNKSMGGHGFLETSAGNAVVPHTKDEADENQGGGADGTLRMSRVAAEQLVADAKALRELRQDVDNEARASLIERFKDRLNPGLIAASRAIPTKGLKSFLEALPKPQVELHEPAPVGGAAGGRMVKLSREDKEVAKLSGKSEADFSKMKEEIGDERLIELAGNVGPAPDKAPKSNWDRKFADHFMTLSLTDRYPDGRPWKPAAGSRFRTVASSIATTVVEG